MSATNISIVQAACVLVGEEPITSFTENTTPAKIASAIYDDLVQNELSLYQWQFASKTVVLNRLTSDPIDNWDAAYAIPTDILDIDTVRVNDYSIEYERIDQYIYCNAQVDDEVVLQGTYVPDESKWPPYFVSLIEYRIAAYFGIAIAHRAEMASFFEKKADTQSMKARHRDSVQQTNKKLTLDGYAIARHNT